MLRFFNYMKQENSEAQNRSTAAGQYEWQMHRIFQGSGIFIITWQNPNTVRLNMHFVPFFSDWFKVHWSQWAEKTSPGFNGKSILETALGEKPLIQGKVSTCFFSTSSKRPALVCIMFISLTWLQNSQKYHISDTC